SPPAGPSCKESSNDTDKLHVLMPSNPAKGSSAYQVAVASESASSIMNQQLKKPVLMTGADKIALWNVMGIQGALLSAFIEPLYLDGIVVSDQSDHTALKRAFYERVNESLLESKLATVAGGAGFRLNRHQVGSYRPNNH